MTIDVALERWTAPRFDPLVASDAEQDVPEMDSSVWMVQMLLEIEFCCQPDHELTKTCRVLSAELAGRAHVSTHLDAIQQCEMRRSKSNTGNDHLRAGTREHKLMRSVSRAWIPHEAMLSKSRNMN